MPIPCDEDKKVSVRARARENLSDLGKLRRDAAAGDLGELHDCVRGSSPEAGGSKSSGRVKRKLCDPSSAVPSSTEGIQIATNSSVPSKKHKAGVATKKNHVRKEVMKQTVDDFLKLNSTIAPESVQHSSLKPSTSLVREILKSPPLETKPNSSNQSSSTEFYSITESSGQNVKSSCTSNEAVSKPHIPVKSVSHPDVNINSGMDDIGSADSFSAKSQSIPLKPSMDLNISTDFESNCKGPSGVVFVPRSKLDEKEKELADLKQSVEYWKKRAEAKIAEDIKLLNEVKTSMHEIDTKFRSKFNSIASRLMSIMESLIQSRSMWHVHEKVASWLAQCPEGEQSPSDFDIISSE